MNQERFAGHLSGLWYLHEFEQRRNDVAEASALRKSDRRICVHEDERNRICGVRREGLSRLLIDHIFRISMVRADKHHSVRLFDRFDRASHALIDGLDRFDRRLLDAGKAGGRPGRRL